MDDIFKVTHDKNVDMEHCIETVNRVKEMVEEIKFDLLNENSDIDCFILIDSINKGLIQAAHYAEQLKWELLKRR